MMSPATTTTPPVPSYWNGRPVVAALKVEPGEHALFQHQWIGVTEEPDDDGEGYQYAVWHFVWTGSHVPQIGSIPEVFGDYAEALRAMFEEAGL